MELSHGAITKSEFRYGRTIDMDKQVLLAIKLPSAFLFLIIARGFRFDFISANI